MSGRLLRIELRRNAAWMLLPLLAALLWVASPYGRALRAPVALWSSRSIGLQTSLQVIGPFVAGMAAWMASREARRGLGDLLASTARGWWSRRLAVLAATAAWSLALYLAAGAVLFGLTAREATWGGPVWWPVVVGGVGVLAFTAAGFAVGAALPGRFTAPLLAIGLLLALQLTLAPLDSNYLLVSPVRDSLSVDASVFFGVDPGMAITQLIFVCGLTVAAVASVAWSTGSGWGRAPGRPAALTAALLAAAGAAAAGTGLALAGTAHETLQGTVIPALHDATAARPVTYTPVCDARSPIPVCVHPAYRSVLPAIARDVAPMTAEVAGLPGAPVRIEFVGAGTPGVTNRHAQLIAAKFINVQGPMTAGEIAASVRYAAAAAITGFQATERLPGSGSPARAQLALVYGLQLAAGEQAGVPPSVPAPIASAAHRFAAMPAAARRAWLAGHLSALRAGRLVLPQLP